MARTINTDTHAATRRVINFNTSPIRVLFGKHSTVEECVARRLPPSMALDL